jgi:putative ABC transport system permease protein
MMLGSNMEHLLGDIKHGIRNMARSPGFTAAAILALALGIGANTAIFSVVNAVLLRPFPYPDPDRLVQIWGSSPDKGIPYHDVFYADANDWKEQSQSFLYLSAVAPGSINLVTGGQPERLSIWRVNARFFPLLGAQMQSGRAPAEDEDRPGAPHVAVLTSELWERSFGAVPNLVGNTILLDGVAHTVIGILKPGFKPAGSGIDLFAPLAVSSARDQLAGAPTVTVFARLKRGISIRQAQAELDGIGSRLAELPNTLGAHPRVWALRDFVVRDVKWSLIVLLVAVGLVLLIACANVANLLLARAGERQREVALRAALGASRGRILAQLLTESSLLGLAGGATGVLLAFWGVRALLRFTPERYPLLDTVSIDVPVLIFTSFLSVVTGIIFGLTPALTLSRTNELNEALKEGGRGYAGSIGRARLRSALVVSEVALALVLLAGAGMTINSFVRLNSVRPGFNPDGVLTASIDLPPAKYQDPQRRMAFWRQLFENIRATPGVIAAGAVSALPLTQYNTGTGCVIEGRPFPRPSEVPIVWFRLVNTDYFRSMEIPLRAGRVFTDHDAAGPRVAVVNETMARRFWPDQDPVGRRFTDSIPRPGREMEWITVVGVVGDMRHKAMDVEPDAETFWPYQQYAPAGLMLTIRTATGETRFAPMLHKAVATVDRDQPVARVRSMAQIAFDSIAPQRVSVALIGIFAVVALLLAVVGIYGVISFSVTRRTREIGVRMALGATSSDVVRMVVCEAMARAGIGLGIGLAASLAVTRFMSTMLYGGSDRGAIILGAVVALLALVAAIASYIPARRASSIDPTAALRCE